MVVPAAPALAEINNNDLYYNALVKSDFAIPDSGFMIIILKLFKGIQLNKLSGVEFLRNFIKSYNNSDKLFLVDPSKENSIINNRFLNNNGINVSIDDHYIAPFYKKDNVIDHKLLNLLEQKRPKFILINLGGGIQEPLGLFLKENLSFQPGIICTGAAIAVLNGRQAPIPIWLDKIHLGWLSRCIHDPKVFIPRYLKGFKLLPLLLKKKIIIKEN